MPAYVPVDAHRILWIGVGLIVLWYPPLGVTVFPFVLAVLYVETRAIVRHRRALRQLRTVLANA